MVKITNCNIKTITQFGWLKKITMGQPVCIAWLGMYPEAPSLLVVVWGEHQQECIWLAVDGHVSTVSAKCCQRPVIWDLRKKNLMFTCSTSHSYTFTLYEYLYYYHLSRYDRLLLSWITMHITDVFSYFIPYTGLITSTST